MRHRRAERGHFEGSRRSLASRHCETRQARHSRAWRGAKTGQAALSRGRRQQADRRAAGLSDLGDLHLSRFRRAGDPRPRGSRAGGRGQDRGDGAGAHSLRTRPPGIRAGVARRGRGGAGRLSLAEGLGRGHELFGSRRIHRDRRAGACARCRFQCRSDADRQSSAAARSRHHGKPLRRARRGARQACRSGLHRAQDRDRQPGRRHRGAARRMRSRAGASPGSRQRNL